MNRSARFIQISTLRDGDALDRVEIDFVIDHYLNAVIVGVSHDDVLVDSETEAAR